MRKGIKVDNGGSAAKSALITRAFYTLYRLTYRVFSPVFMWGPMRHVRPYVSKAHVTLRQRFRIAQAVPNPIQTREGLTFYYPDAAVWIARTFVDGSYEAGTCRLLGTLLQPGMTVVDLGANIGYYSLICARAVSPEGRVYSFECAPINISYLVKNVEINGYNDVVITVPMAVSNRSGPVRLFWDDEAPVSASISAGQGDRNDESSEVLATTLDDYFSTIGWPPINIVKMDIEGSEKDALEGMRESCSRNPGIKLILEFNPTIPAVLARPDDLFRALDRFGFSRISLIEKKKILPLKLPQDIPNLILTAKATPYGCVNIFCEQV